MVDEPFDALVRWLEEEHGMTGLRVRSQVFLGAGRGLVVSEDIPYNSFVPPPDIVSIPTSALLNARTVASLYPRSFSPRPITDTRKKTLSSKDKAKTTPSSHLPLTSTQLLTLHLALHRPDPTETSDAPPTGHPSLPADPWGPYLRTIPARFDEHPLTWIVDVDAAAEIKPARPVSSLARLAECLPRKTGLLLDDVERRFWDDVRILHEVVANDAHFASLPAGYLSLSFLLWAWLAVNTRCLSYPLALEPADGTNDFTLCPIVDLANHSTESTPIPHLLPPDGPPSKIKTYALPAQDRAMKAGEQIFLQYGGHEDGFLLAEYGFVAWGGNRWNEHDVTPNVEKLFDALPSSIRTDKVSMLEKLGYWGNYTLHKDPAPAHPSYRLLVALRLYHTSPTSASASIDGENTVANWRDMLDGFISVVSDSNEALVFGTLRSLCATVETEVEAGLGLLAKIEGEGDLWDSAKKDVESLWESSRSIAKAVVQSLDDEIEF